MQSKYHSPVMLQECLDGLNIHPDGTYVDVTFGGGGHSRAILSRLSAKGKLIAFDQDSDAKANLPEDPRLIFIDQNFEFLENHLAFQECLPVDGILADLGVSSHQFDEGSRGFSFRFDDAELDMRMDFNSGKPVSALLNSYSEKEISDILYYYGELKNSRSLAASIVAYRTANPIKTVADFKEAIRRQTPKLHEYKFYAQVFQALRIEVNREMDVLKAFLEQSAKVLKPGGRLVVMSYHSLEDRLVKNFMASGNFEGELEKDFFGNSIRPLDPITRKVVTATDAELTQNPRSRSAKLRIAERRSLG
ncbi:MAG: 16S rRNA (cytosine(1402)-N(4))-methyltransferase RsmH [Bacteroidia bacterium]|nr:16S rRNA (cytosine(1402)-N(4))-methyltransferase RsmH [Bacteroidia bacterium]